MSSVLFYTYTYIRMYILKLKHLDQHSVSEKIFEQNLIEYLKLSSTKTFLDIYIYLGYS